MGQHFEPQQIHPHIEPRVVSYGGVTCFPQPFNSRTMIPPPGNRLVSILVTCPRITGGFPTSNGAFKRKNVEGYSRNFQGFYPGYGSSSSVATSERSMMDATTSFGARLVHGGQPTQSVPTLCHGANGVFSWDRAHGVPYLQGIGQLYFLCVMMYEWRWYGSANMGIHGYQVASMSRNSSTFMHPPPLTSHQGTHNLYHPPPPPPLPPMPPPVQAQNMDIHLHLASTSHRHSISTSIGNPFQNNIESGSRFVGPTPPNGLRVYESRRRESMIESTTRHRSFTNLRVLPEDGVAILDIPDYHEVGPLVDHHNDMRLDIDHMSYEASLDPTIYKYLRPPVASSGVERVRQHIATCVAGVPGGLGHRELLALGEQIGNAGSGLSETSISDHLKTRTFRSCNPEDPNPIDEECNFCVICQMEFEEQEKIGVLDCCHDYHSECIKKWLMVKNACPICKSTAIAL
ncbi:hypothetical protein OSB04_015485 [Centaurea solstitialis]|uniref:RING-type E3 ubiquitin transferase n=1 Tax=Centaurea solstitialis TaxID=347529 RepID=A0AA38TB49_9ASTR|nr:hypothetical protein OSB04_015485 [Centaurea solstitialis]